MMLDWRNHAAAQTKMMEPGAQEDTLDDIFSFYNFKTIESFGKYP